MDFLANFGKTLPNELKSLGIDSKEILLKPEMDYD